MILPRHLFRPLLLLALCAPARAQSTPAAVAAPVEPAGTPAEPTLASESGVAGERLPESALGRGLVESVEQMLRRAQAAREAEAETGIEGEGEALLGASRPGEWIVPSRGASGAAHSGVHYLTNEWGDPRMAIGFGARVRVESAWIGGQSARGAWPESLVVVGFAGGVEIARSAPFEAFGASPALFAIELDGVDRIEFRAQPAQGQQAWFALDDLRFTRGARAAGAAPEEVLLDFEDLPWRARLSGSGYAGLDWERASTRSVVDPGQVRAIPAPQVLPMQPADPQPKPPPGPAASPPAPGTLPSVLNEFQGMRMFENGTSAIPADTCGAVGPDHFVSVVNVKLCVFDKTSGTRLFELPLVDFFQATALGDARVAYDQHSGRFLVLCSSGPGTARLYLALSMSADATGPWYKTYIDTAVGSDAGLWPDYPTLGYDANGIYSSALMVPSSVTLFAIDKAPLLSATPSLGSVTAWRGLAFEGATQPCATYGDSGGELVVGRPGNSKLRMRQISGPLTAPTLSTLANIPISFNVAPQDAPALGSVVDLDTADARPMNAVYRNGSVFTVHAIRVDSRAAVRWYELDVASGSLAQSGTISDPVWHYSYPSIAVNAAGHMLLAFSGSHAGAYASNFYSGRHALDPPGASAAPALLRAGVGPYNHVDGNGIARWGDYSLSTVDPDDDSTLWTIQMFARANDRWGTWIAELAFQSPCPSTWSSCVGASNSVGSGARMASSGGTSVAANDLVLQASGAPPTQLGVFFYGNSLIQNPLGNGFLCVAGNSQRLPVLAIDASGVASWPLDLAHPPSAAGQITAGSTWYFQFWYRDPSGGGAAFNLSDALGASFCP